MLGLAPPLSAVATAVLVHKLVGRGNACAATQQDIKQGACRQQGSAETRANAQQLAFLFTHQLAQSLHAGLAPFSLLLLCPVLQEALSSLSCAQGKCTSRL